MLEQQTEQKATPPESAANQPSPAAPPLRKSGEPGPPQTRKRWPGLFIAAIVGILILIGGFAFWRYAQTYESTDDAQVDGHLNGIASRIQGTITAVYVDTNQAVTAGQVLVDLDPRDYKVAADQAKAQMAQAEAQIQAEHPNIPITQTTSATTNSMMSADVHTAEAAVASAESEHAAALARLREAEANSAKAQADVTRYKMLVDKDEIPRQQYDQVVATAQALAAAVESARAAADSARKIVDQRRSQVDEAKARLTQVAQNAPLQLAVSQANLKSRQAAAQGAKAQVDRALLDLSYTKIVSPIAGIVSKRAAEIGNHVQPGQQLFVIAQTNDLWVTANFKETQLRRMRPGLPVTVEVDAFNQKFDGYVESLPAATGAISSLLPPENATGNYVKVVQRLPTRIRFKQGQAGLERLRPGMSVVPTVWLQ